MNSEMKIEKKILSFVIALAMVITMVPMFGVEAWAYTASDIKYIDANGDEKTCTTATAVEPSNSRVTWTAGWYVVNSNVTINGGVTVSGGAVHLILADGCNITVSAIAASGEITGISVNEGASLTIYEGSTSGATTGGALNVCGSSLGSDASGIKLVSGSSITINGGAVNISGNAGGNFSTGYGLNCNTNSNITINGGTVDVSSTSTHSGIGISGAYCSKITINGGIVTANGSGDNLGYGIFALYNSPITINGGTVTASGKTSGICGVASSSVKVNKNLILKAGSAANEISYTSVPTMVNELADETSNISTCKYASIMPVVASVNTDHVTYYGTVQEAINAATPSGLKVTLEANVNLTDYIDIAAGDVTLDLNGYVLNQTTNASVIQNFGGNLTITDSTYGCDDRLAHYFTYSSTAAWNWNDDADISKAITVGAINSETSDGDVIVVYGGCITGGSATSNNGGGIIVDGALTMSAINIVGNMAINYGGGVHIIEMSTVNMAGCCIAGNQATYGGGISNTSGAALSITSSSVIGNVASSTSGNVYGGGIDNYQGSITMSKVTVSYNKAISLSLNAFGGGVYSEGTMVFNDCSIIGNSVIGSGVYGGGIDNYEGSITMSAVTIEDNTVSGQYIYGGSIRNVRGSIAMNTVTVENITTTSNGTGEYDGVFGGGIYNYEGSITMSAVTIEGITARGQYVYGGGIDNYQGSITMSAVAIENITASGQRIYGGSIRNVRGSIAMNTVTVENITTTSNGTGEYDGVFGGGIYNYEGSITMSAVTIEGITVSGQSAYGGGIDNYQGSITMSAVTIEGITAISSSSYVCGGGIYNFGSMTMDEVTIENITGNGGAEVDGGGICNYGTMAINAVTIKNVTSSGPEVWGSGIFNYVSLTISGASITDNKAIGTTVCGVGVCHYDGTLNMSGNVTVLDNTINDTTSSNIYICSGQSITVDGLSVGSNIGITTEYAPTNTTKVMFASGANINKDYFFSDNDTYTIKPLSNVLYLAVTGSDNTSYSGGGGASTSTTTYTVASPTSTHGKVTASVNSSASGKLVTLTVTPDKGWTLETITVTDKNGKEVELTAVSYGEKYTFIMPSSNVTVTATFMEDNTMLNYFFDVTVDDYFYDAVLWAAENGITGGVDATHFGPNQITTRAQMITFLWNLAGKPEPTITSCVFEDVDSSAYYYKAVLWAIENNVTAGTSDTTFSPDNKLTRGETVTFLYKYSDENVGTTVNVFTDVAASDWYYNAVLWAKENGITAGKTDTTFGPQDSCTRGQIMVFIYNYAK